MSSITKIDGFRTVGALEGSARNGSAFSYTPPPLKVREVKLGSANMSSGVNWVMAAPSTSSASDTTSRTEAPSNWAIWPDDGTAFSRSERIEVLQHEVAKCDTGWMRQEAIIGEDG